MDIIGRVTANAQVRIVSGDRKVVNFSVAVKDSYKAKNGERVTQTDFFDCSYWIASGIAAYLTKGTIVELTGRVSARAWINSEGEAKAGLNFHASKIRLHSREVSNSITATNTEQGVNDTTAANMYNVEGTQVNSKGEEDDFPF